jgi:hypothetical protein
LQFPALVHQLARQNHSQYLGWLSRKRPAVGRKRAGCFFRVQQALSGYIACSGRATRLDGWPAVQLPHDPVGTGDRLLC